MPQELKKARGIDPIHFPMKRLPTDGSTRSQFVVSKEDAKVRLDRFLAKQLPEYSRSRLQQLIRAGFVRLAAALAADPQRRAAYKQQLRAEVVRSPLCDVEGLARALDAAFLGMADAHNAALARVTPSA